MTKQQHPITPPLELVQHWDSEAVVVKMPEKVYIATQAANWGADRQLEECVAWLDGYERDGWAAKQMRNDLRPKPPSLKEQALDAWDRLRNEAWCEEIDWDLNLVRRALEQLND